MRLPSVAAESRIAVGMALPATSMNSVLPPPQHGLPDSPGLGEGKAAAAIRIHACQNRRAHLLN